MPVAMLHHYPWCVYLQDTWHLVRVSLVAQMVKTLSAKWETRVRPLGWEDSLEKGMATFFSSTHGTFSRIDHILGHKSSLGKFKKKIEIISSIFSDYYAVRLDLNYRRESSKNSKIWRVNNTLLNNQPISEEIKKEIKICIERMKMKTRQPKTYGTL